MKQEYAKSGKGLFSLQSMLDNEFESFCPSVSILLFDVDGKVLLCNHSDLHRLNRTKAQDSSARKPQKQHYVSFEGHDLKEHRVLKAPVLAKGQIVIPTSAGMQYVTVAVVGLRCDAWLRAMEEKLHLRAVTIEEAQMVLKDLTIVTTGLKSIYESALVELARQY